MALALCLLFDARTERLLRALWTRLESHGIRTLESHTHGEHHPHLSYAVLLAWDLGHVLDAARDLSDRGPFELSVQGTVAFPRGRAALAPAVPPDVGNRQATVVTALVGTGAMLHRHYEPGRWVPHISVATRASGPALTTVANAVADTLPLVARVDRAALIDSSTGQTWLLPVIP